MLACGRSRTLASYKFRHGQWWWCSCHGTAVLHQEIEHFRFWLVHRPITSIYLPYCASIYIMHGWRGELIKCNILLFISHCSPVWKKKACHYYRNANLSRLGNPCCPGFSTENARPGQKGGPFVLCQATGTKGYAASATWLAHPFVPVGVTNRDKRSLFSCFLVLNSFSISIILLHFN